MDRLIFEELKRMREIMFFDDPSKTYLIENAPAAQTNTNQQTQDQDKYLDAISGPLTEFNTKYENLDLRVELLSGSDLANAKIYPTETTEPPNMVKVSRYGNESTVLACKQKIDPKTKAPVKKVRDDFSDPFLWVKFAETNQRSLFANKTQNYNAGQLSEIRYTLQNDGVDMCEKICQSIDLINKGIDPSAVGPDAKIDKATGKLIFQQKGTGSNNYIEPRISVTEKTEGNTIYWDVVGFGYFPTSLATSAFVSTFIKKIQDEVFKNPKITETINKGQKDLITVTLANVRGGASNYYGGKTTAEISGLTDSNVGNPGPKTVTGDVKFTKNKELAKKRATNVLNAIKTQLPSNTTKKIRVSKSLKELVSGYVVDTGGVDDNSDKRDWNTYPIPGQHVYVFMRIELRPILEPDKVKSKSCLFNSTISMDFGFSNPKRVGTGGAHVCDSATFDVFANGIRLGQIDLGNRDFSLKKVDTTSEQGVTATSVKASSEGGAVSGSLQITSQEMADKIIDASVSGEVKITIKGKDHTFYTKRGLPIAWGGKYNYDELATHSEIPWIKVTSPTNVVLFNQEPTTSQSIPRCGGSKNSTAEYQTPCPEWSVAEFNPCGKNISDGTLSTVLDKTQST